MTFKEFLSRYNNGTIADDAAWRAYNIEAMANSKHADAALSIVGIGVGKGRTDHDYSTVGAWYGTGTTERTKYLLSLWYVFRAISLGDRKRAILREPKQGGI